MNLLIDLGNTRLKWACYQDMQMLSAGGYKYNAEQLPASLSREWLDIKKPDKICVSSDADKQLTHELIQWVDTHWGVQVHIISPKDHAYGVKNAYKIPSQLGSDRWAALVAVKNNIKQTAIIVDCGTAITIDAITETGVHQGGLILPGVQLMRDALSKGTHKIETSIDNSAIDHKEMPVAHLASNTIDGIKSGVHTATVAYINSVVEHVYSALSQSTAITQTSNQQNNMQITNIMTGGDADILLPHLKESYLHRPHLVLEGLAIILDDLK